MNVPEFSVSIRVVVASGEKNCWPDKSLSTQYPDYSDGHVMRYLNSGVIAGSLLIELRRTRLTRTLMTANISFSRNSGIIFDSIFFVSVHGN